jgi:hypothetical protein
VTTISTDYFKTLAIPLVAGRDFSEEDREGSPKVAIVNEKLAKHFFGTTDPIGKKIGLGKAPDFVLGNKVMVGTVNANREYFEMGVKDLAQAEAEYPGWLALLLTHPVKGLENYNELFDKLTNARGAIKVFCEVSHE